MNKLIQAIGVLIAIVAGVVAVVGYLQFEPSRGNDQQAVYMTLFGFVTAAIGVIIWMGARAVDWLKRQ